MLFRVHCFDAILLSGIMSPVAGPVGSINMTQESDVLSLKVLSLHDRCEAMEYPTTHYWR